MERHVDSVVIPPIKVTEGTRAIFIITTFVIILISHLLIIICINHKFNLR